MEVERRAWAGGGVSAQLPIPSSLPCRTIIQRCPAPAHPSYPGFLGFGGWKWAWAEGPTLFSSLVWGLGGSPTLHPLVLKKRQESGGGSGKRSRREEEDRNREEHAKAEAETPRQGHRDRVTEKLGHSQRQNE